MDIYKFRELLERYLEGQANETEKALVEAWYKTYAVDEQELSDIEAARIRNAIRATIKLETPKRRIISMPMLRIAASVLIAASAAFLIKQYLFNNPNYYTVQTGMRGMKKVVLPDNSTVWLNAETRVKVPEHFEGQFRTVILENGEAFFDVQHDSNHPFIVKVNQLNVQVYGTSFNIRSYKKMGNITVAVATGKVGVTRGAKTLAMLLPDDLLNYQIATGTFTSEHMPANRSQSWKSGYTYLADADFNELSVIVKNLFGLSLKTTSKQISGYHFTCRVNHNSGADEVLTMIGQLHNTHYRKEGDEVVFY